MKIIVVLLACSTALVTQSTPHIAAVVNGADFSPGIAFGGFATIFGTNLSDGVYQAGPAPPPTSLGPTQVQLCGFFCAYAQLVYASPTQINFLVPTLAQTEPPGEIVNNGGVVTVSVNGVVDDGALANAPGGQNLGLLQPEPRLFFEGYDCFIDPRYQDANKDCGLTFTQGSTNRAYRGAITDQQWNLVSSSNPARFGQYYTLWMTGFGAVTNGDPNGYLTCCFLSNVPLYAAGGLLLSPVWNQEENISPSYLGESSVFPGLYQVNFQLLAPMNSQYPSPSGVPEPPGAYPCGQFNWEFGFELDPLMGLAYLDILNGGYPTTPDSAGFSIPIHVEPGDVPCGG